MTEHSTGLKDVELVQAAGRPSARLDERMAAIAELALRGQAGVLANPQYVVENLAMISQSPASGPDSLQNAAASALVTIGRRNTVDRSLGCY